MIPIRDSHASKGAPVVTYTLIALNTLVYLWDRQWHLFGGNVAFADLTLRPNEVLAAAHLHQDHFALLTVFTAMFLHANLMHLLGNMIFLLVFGPGVEQALGGNRFAFYYLFWGIVAAGTHIAVNPASSAPVLGASGAIGGVLGAYLLLFPGNRIEIMVPILLFLSFEMSAWVMLGIWFLWQILIPQNGVANWAHAGGFLAGMVTVLIMGGRKAVLRGRESEFA